MAKCVYLESWFEMRILNHDSKYGILDRVYAKSRRDSWFEMRISNHGPEVFSSYASQIMNLDVIWRTHGPEYRISNRDSRCASRITIQNTHFAVVWKQSKILFVPKQAPLKGKSRTGLTEKKFQKKEENIAYNNIHLKKFWDVFAGNIQDISYRENYTA